MAHDGAELTSLLRNDLEGHLTLLVLEEAGESRTTCDDFAEMLRAYPEIRVLHLRLEPTPKAPRLNLLSPGRYMRMSISRWCGREPQESVEAALREDAAPYWRWAKQALAAAESINLFEKCRVALAGEEIQQREARHLGYEDGFMAGAPPDSLVLRLAREAAAHREARRRGSSPPCFL